MKQFGWLAAGLVVGVLLGGIPERLDNQRLSDEITKLEAKLRERPKTGEMARNLFNLPALEEVRRAKDQQPAAFPDDRPPTDTANPEPELTFEMGDDDIVAEEDEGLDADQFAVAVETQKVRIAQSREALRQEADLDDEQMAELDRIVDDLNADLSGYADVFVDIALSDQDPTSAEMLGMTHDLTGVLYDSQVALDDLVGETSFVDEESRSIWNYVDLETFAPAVDRMADEEGAP